MIHPEIFLRQVPLFRSLRLEDIRRLATNLTQQVLKKGDILFREGEDGEALYMIIAGKLKIVRQSQDGGEMILAVLGEGDFCGEMALLDGLCRSADAVAAENTQLYGLSRKDFLSFVMSNETLVRSILETLSKRLRRADDLLDDIFFLNVSARLVKKLIELAVANGHTQGQTAPAKVKVPQKDLAGMVASSRESVNTELRALREKGLISFSGNTLLVHDLEALRQKIR
jgi:CRP/FNR family transcriptional regulator/CRP/FNR family cyclic AMP-dependent transcriptional regulator